MTQQLILPNGDPASVNGAGEKDVNAQALAASVIDNPAVSSAFPGAPMIEPMLMMIGDYADEMVAWGRMANDKQRERQLRAFVATEPMFASALGVVCARNAAFSWALDGPPRTVKRAQEMLEQADEGRGWESFITKLSIDLYTQDAGAFVELVRLEDNPTSPIVQLNHLDAGRCLSRNTRVHLADGSCPTVRDVVEQRHPGPVLSLGPDGRIIPAEITNWHTSPLAGRTLLRFVLQNSLLRAVPNKQPRRLRRGKIVSRWRGDVEEGQRERLWVTDDHQMLTPDGWRPAGALAEGDHLMTKYPAPSNEQTPLLLGAMLGDSSINAGGSFGLGHSPKQRAWLELKQKALQGFQWTPTRGKTFLQTGTFRTPAFKQWRSEWYRGGYKKRVPREKIETHFNDLLLAVWWADDGYLNRGKEYDRPGQWGRPRGLIYTLSFDQDEVDWLVELLNAKGIEAAATYAKKNTVGEDCWQIYIPPDGMEELGRRVAPYLPPCVRYKLPRAIEQAVPFNEKLWELAPAVAFADEILDIRTSPVPDPEQQVYCIDVAETHNFVAGGAVVHNCYHTGDPNVPVIYQDRLGRYHLLKWYQVRHVPEMPAAQEGLYGTQYCALTRLFRAAQILKNISIYKYEKTGGRHQRAIHLVAGFSTKQIETALRTHNIFSDQLGMRKYAQPPIVGTADPNADLKHVVLELASLPDNYNEETTFKQYIAQIAMAFLTDYQEFAPLPGGNLGTSTQSEVLHAKSRGKGSGLFRGLITKMLNFYVLPSIVTFDYREQDAEAEGLDAEIKERRANTRKTMVETGEITPEEARQLAVDAGDLPSEFLERDITPNVTVTDDERLQEPKEPALGEAGKALAPSWISRPASWYDV